MYDLCTNIKTPSGYKTHLSHNSDVHPVSGRLLLRLAKDINVPSGLVGHVRDVVAAGVLANLADLIHFFLRQVDLLEVLDDTVWSHGLGDDTVAAHLGPGQDDLRRCHGPTHTLGGTVGDLLDLVPGDEKGFTDHVVTKGRVGGDVDALLLAVGDQGVGLQERVTFDLVGSGNDAGGSDDGLEL